MFPVRDDEGRILGFAGRGTHLGPSWSLWVTSPANGIYRPSEAVFGLDTAAVAREQMEALAERVPGGIDALELDLPPGMRADPKDAEAAPAPTDRPRSERPAALPEAQPPHRLKRLAIVIATALATVNVWTGAPLLAVWVGSQVRFCSAWRWSG